MDVVNYVASHLVPAPSPALDSILAAFDADMAEFEARVAQAGGHSTRNIQ